MSKKSKHQIPKSPASTSKPATSPPGTPGTRTWLVGSVLVALLGLIGVGLLAASQVLGPRTQTELTIHATETAEAKLTQIARAATATPPQASASSTAAAFITPTPIASAAPTPTFAPKCPYVGMTDQETLVNLISAEAEAVNAGKAGGGVDIIRSIFDRAAIISDAVSGESWTDPIDRYTKLLETTEYFEVEHFDILPAGPGIAKSVAFMSSGSSGKWRVGSGKPSDFSNGSTTDPKTPYGSDHWTFGKNSDGCWQITRFVFNAGHVPFPP